MVEISVLDSLPTPYSIVFLNTRQAMIFISTMFGTDKINLRTLGFDGISNMVNCMTFRVTMVLLTKEFVSYLSIRHRPGKC